MDFQLSEDHQMIREMVRDFAEKEVAPVIMGYDERQEFPWAISRKLSELGMYGILFDPEYGGSGMSYVHYALILEELARVDGSVALTVAAHNSLCSNHINIAGTEEQKRRYLPPLASGEKLGAWALTEPGSGSDAGGMRTTAVEDGDGWVLNGTKNFITNATVGQIAVVLARTDPEKGNKGISAFIIDYDTPGFSAAKKENKLGMRSSDTAQLVMVDCRIPRENLLGGRGRGFIDSMRILDGGRISIAALGVGLAQGAVDHSLAYSRTREQFGKPIGEFQAIQWMLADMATETDAARLLTLQAAVLKDQGREVTKESAMAKYFAGETSVRNAVKAVQIFGGYGMSKDYPVEKIFRDCKLCTIGEGTSEIQKMVIARKLFA
jgi:alkylation response protein AidB-like acyl-CoA dehydrogenase